jgi:transglutaminase-like putative cysteine protease
MTLLLVMAAPQPGETGPTGASRAWTSTDPLVRKAAGLLTEGKYAEAEKALAADEGRPAPEAAQARREMTEIIRRIRIEYSLDEAGLLRRLKNAIPDVTADDLRTWRDAGQVRFRVIDGKVRYLKIEPSCLLRACPDARKRQEANQPTRTPAAADARSKKKLGEHLAQVVTAAENTGKAEIAPIRHHVTYTLTVSPNRPGAKAGSLVRCWLPFPQEYRQQKDVKLIRTSPAERTIAPNAMDASGASNPKSEIEATRNPKSEFAGAPQRTVYLEQKIEDPSKPIVFEEEFEYTSYAYYPKLNESEARELSPGFDPRYLAERPPHILFTPEIQAIVEQAVGNEKNPLAKVRKIYQYLDGKVHWWPEEEYSTIPCFCMKPLMAGYGDCGLQSTLFVTCCRAAGVPARWQSGWESMPWDSNMHDWSEVYIEPWGWLPVDMSYGLQPSEDSKIKEFYIGHQDAYRLIVNLDYGQPLVPAKKDMRSEPADFQRGEVELDGRNLYFDEWEYNIKFDHKPLE